MPDRFADIVLPLAPTFFTFSIPPEIGTLVPGSAVTVPLGERKIYTGIVWRIHDQRPPYEVIKPILRRLFDFPLLLPEQMRFWEWIADYYMCSLGDVMRAVLPALLKPSGFSDEEYAHDGFRPRKASFVAFAETISDEVRLHEACESVRKASRQYAALLELAESLPATAMFDSEVARNLLKAKTTTLHLLEKKGFIRITERETVDPENPFGPSTLPPLSPAQQKALEQLREAWSRQSAVLLQGVPSSGKSELFFYEIDRVLQRGGDVLLLLPEIALSTQFVERVQRAFGNRVLLYHSKITNRKRSEIYLRLLRRPGGNLVVGVRSSLFLPLARLKLIVVDEEHDSSYKQQDTAPRYHARDTALMLGRFFGAQVILSSATPSLESYLNAVSGRYGHVRLAERWGGSPAPQVILSDTIRSAKRGERKSHFNKELLDALRHTLAVGEQAILFQNRRGFAPYIECESCGWTARCPHCNVTLTHHRTTLRCHYCGHHMPIPEQCPQCGGAVIPRGFGTEKAEIELQRLLPEARINRLDRDTTPSESAYRRIIDNFKTGRTDILIGTQMVTKGFDFERVTLVGVLNADNLLNYPDFRAEERAFQLLTQVAGRAGRRSEQGTVIIQTAQPNHPVIREALDGNFEKSALRILEERRTVLFPPYCRLVSITLLHRDRQRTIHAARMLEKLLRPRFGDRLLGPQSPLVERIRNEYVQIFLLKTERNTPFSEVRGFLREASAQIVAVPEFKSVSFIFDVDPQ